MSFNLTTMKTWTYLFIFFNFLFYNGSLRGEGVIDKSNSSSTGSMILFCSTDLKDLTSKWAWEYSKLNPDITIKVNVVPNVHAALETNANLGFISNEFQPSAKSESNWKIQVGRDIIVPVINSNNPYLSKILRQGISQHQFAQLFEYPDKHLWGTLLDTIQNTPVHLYIVNDESIKEGVKRFLNINQFPVEGIRLSNTKEMITAIQNDPFAVGFCKMVNILDPDKQIMVDKIRLLPIDKNGNGKIDYMEKIYDDLNVFQRGVWIGKYPKTLYRDIYSISSTQPEDVAETAFLKWVLTDGQQFLYLSGFSDLVNSERQSKLDNIDNKNTIYIPPSEESYSIPKLILLILAALIIISVIISAIVRYARNKNAMAPVAPETTPISFNEKSLVVPKGLYFDKTHTWAFMETDGTVKIGIDDFLQHVTGRITRIEMNKPGEKVKKGELLLSIIQNGKQLSIYSPISGTIKEQNKSLSTNASIINSSPYYNGWVYRIEPANWLKEIPFLSMAEKYIKWLPEEFTRLKDFLAVTLNTDRTPLANVALQDGGVLKDNILTDLGPEVWEDFQTGFLDIFK
jgi:glycine cleavage system H lipoate-binding protein/ABC-type phosphate transport system substrate-binding protein